MDFFDPKTSEIQTPDENENCGLLLSLLVFVCVQNRSMFRNFFSREIFHQMKKRHQIKFFLNFFQNLIQLMCETEKKNDQWLNEPKDRNDACSEKKKLITKFNLFVINDKK